MTNILSPGTIIYYIIPVYDEIDTVDFKCFQAKIASVIWNKSGVKYFLDTKNERYKRVLFSHNELFTSKYDAYNELQRKIHDSDNYKFEFPKIINTQVD